MFKWMLKEEWRMHTRMTSTWRVLLFPFVIALLLLVSFNLIQPDESMKTFIAALVHFVLFVVGLQIGSISFSGQETIENILANHTFLLYSSRTQPVSLKKSLILHLAKDTVYYGGLVSLPVTIGFALVLPLVELPILFVSTLGMLLLGILGSLVAISTAKQGKAAKTVMVSIALIVSIAILFNLPLIYLVPYGFFVMPTVWSLFSGFASVISGILIGTVLFTTKVEDSLMRIDSQYDLFKRLTLSSDAIGVKTVMEIHRSEGGLVKMFLSVLLILGASIYFVLQTAGSEYFHQSTLTAAFLSLSVLLTYVWVFRFDSVMEYTFFPTDVYEVMQSKIRTLLILTLPLLLLSYPVVYGVLNVEVIDFVFGFLVLTSLTTYYSGVVIHLGWATPNQSLTDVIRFGLLIIAVLIPLIPTVLFGVSGMTFTIEVFSLGAFVLGIFALVGVQLLTLAPQQWNNSYVR